MFGLQPPRHISTLPFTSVWACPLPAALRTSILEARSRWVSDPLSRQAMFQMAHTYEMMANLLEKTPKHVETFAERDVA